jgi:superfamily II DNA or RNA helicase
MDTPLSMSSTLFTNKYIFSSFFEEAYSALSQKPQESSTLILTTGYMGLADWVYKIKELLSIFPLLTVKIHLGTKPTFQHDSVIRKSHHDIILPYSEVNIQEYNIVKDLFGLLAPKKDGSVALQFMLLDSEKVFLHAKTGLLIMDSNPVLGVTGSMNLTYSGGNKNEEAAVIYNDKTALTQHLVWCQSLPQVPSNDTIIEAYQHMAKYQTLPDVYFTMLQSVYGGREVPVVTDYDMVHWLKDLYPHQKDGALQAWQIMQEYNGVLIADEVGLGKTFTAIALMRKTRVLGKRTLIVVPTVLKTVWNNALESAEFTDYYELIGYNEVESFSQKEEDRLLRYGLIIFDEAHWLRNIHLGKEKTSQRSQAVERLVYKAKAKVALLTATPVNNNLQDLSNELSLFIKDDILKEEGWPSLKFELKKLDKNPLLIEKSKVFSQLLSKIAVIRTRNFIRTKYAENVELKFPRKIEFQRKNYELSPSLEKLVMDVVSALKPDTGKLVLSAYRPSLFLLKENDKKGMGELRNNALIRLNLLKRLDSSLPALILSLETLHKKTFNMIELMEKSKIDESQAFTKIQEESISLDESIKFEDFDGEENITGTEEEPLASPTIRVRDLDKDKYLLYLTRDLAVIEKWLSISNTILEKEPDTKLEELSKMIAERLKDKLYKKTKSSKIIIFTTDMGTANYIKQNLYEAISKQSIVNMDSSYGFTADKIEVITGNVSSKNKELMLARFAPTLNSHMSISKKSEIDILITTDVLSEGANLQESDTVIHYNLPWNPIRALQRVGRIDRIKSEHEIIHSICFYPGKFIEDFLKLDEIIKSKLLKARNATGTNTKGIDGQEVVEDFFKSLKKPSEDILDSEEQIENIAMFSEATYISQLEEMQAELAFHKIPLGAGALVENSEKNRLLLCLRIPYLGNQKRIVFYDINLDTNVLTETAISTALSEVKNIMADENNQSKTLIPFHSDSISVLAESYKSSVGRIMKQSAESQKAVPSFPEELIAALNEQLQAKTSRVADMSLERYAIESFNMHYPTIFVARMQNIYRTEPKNLLKIFLDESARFTSDPFSKDMIKTIQVQDIEVVTWVRFLKRKNPITPSCSLPFANLLYFSKNDILTPAWSQKPVSVISVEKEGNEVKNPKWVRRRR